MGRERIVEDPFGMNISIPRTHQEYLEINLGPDLLPDPGVLAREIKEAQLVLHAARKLRPTTPVPEPDAWREHARCLGTDPALFYPNNGAGVDKARVVCATCPVTEECLEYALSTGEKFGVWGGTSERERRLKLRTAIVPGLTSNQS